MCPKICTWTWVFFSLGHTVQGLESVMFQLPAASSSLISDDALWSCFLLKFAPKSKSKLPKKINPKGVCGGVLKNRKWQFWTKNLISHLRVLTLYLLVVKDPFLKFCENRAICMHKNGRYVKMRVWWCFALNMCILGLVSASFFIVNKSTKFKRWCQWHMSTEPCANAA